MLWLAASVATASVAPEVFAGIPGRPLAWLATLLAVVGIAMSFVHRRAGRDLAAFLGSAAFLLGILAATAASIYPTMLKSATDPALSLTAMNSAASATSLTRGLWWWPVGLLLAIAYAAFLFRFHRGKVQAAAEGEGY